VISPNPSPPPPEFCRIEFMKNDGLRVLQRVFATAKDRRGFDPGAVFDLVRVDVDWDALVAGAGERDTKGQITSCSLVFFFFLC
jgi:hypothetical protein